MLALGRLTSDDRGKFIASSALRNFGRDSRRWAPFDEYLRWAHRPNFQPNGHLQHNKFFQSHAFPHAANRNCSRAAPVKAPNLSRSITSLQSGLLGRLMAQINPQCCRHGARQAIHPTICRGFFP
jgi:hypothetical protein